VKARSVVASFTVVPFLWETLSEICLQVSDGEAEYTLNALPATAVAVQSCVFVFRHAAVIR
jgi:hypothetical protein